MTRPPLQPSRGIADSSSPANLTAVADAVGDGSPANLTAVADAVGGSSSPADLSSATDGIDSSSPRFPMLITVDQLPHLCAQPEVLLVAVLSDEAFANGHIPGSVLVQPEELVSGLWPATGKLPDADQLSTLGRHLGLTPNRHLIAYDNEGGGWAGRLLWTLDVLGHPAWSYLDGGLRAWRGAGLSLSRGLGVTPQPTSNSPVAAPPRPYQATINPAPVVTLEQVWAQLDNPNTVIWDTRAPEEYRGERVTAARNGHIPGAVNLNWLELMAMHNHRRLKPLPELSRLLAARGITPAKDIIVHCQTHHRSSLAYLVGRLLQLNIRAYDGSWAEWGNHPGTPIATGVATSP